MGARTSGLVKPAASAGVHGRAIPSLDGLRALSVGAVVLTHMVLDTPGLLPVWLTQWVLAMGPVGVRIFFVISGFLITTLLLQDEERHGRVRLGRFYVRRVLRIFPPFYVFLAVVALVTMLGRFPADGRAWPAWTYTSNFLPTYNWRTAHSWSLAVEEQFYLTWPLILARFGRKRGGRIALDVCLAMPSLRGLVALVTGDSWIGANVAFDFLAVGCLLALHPEWVARILEWFAPRGALIALLALLLVGAEGAVALGGAHATAFELIPVESAEAATIGLAVAWCVAHPRSAVGRILNAWPLRVVGVGSYSIYLWQQLFFGAQLPGYTIPGAMAATAAMAGASYLFVERPSLALRRRIENWWTRRQTAGDGIPIAAIRTT